MFKHKYKCIQNLHRIKFRPYSNSTKFTMQYISDVHIDIQPIPEIKKMSDYLAICGDIGYPNHHRFKEFLAIQSAKFKKVFFVPGNHDFDLGSIYCKLNIDKWESFVKDICKKFNNVYYLNCNTLNISYRDDILIAGCTLWSKQSTIEHNRHVDWIKNIVNNNPNKKIVMLTHFVPSYHLIEKKYHKKGEKIISRFATDLEYLIKPPIKAWICGHTHSVIEKKINDVHCAINAYGHNSNKKYHNINKIVVID